MSIHAIIFVDNTITSDAELTFDGEFIPDVIASKLASINNIEAIHYSIPSTYTGKLKLQKNLYIYTNNDSPTFWNEFFSKSGAIHAIKILSDAAFFQPSIIEEMLAIHIKYLAEFTFSYNLPAGYACEIISKTALDNPLANSNATDSLCDIVKSNLNQFDVELYYKEPDIRWHRVNFKASNIRDKLVMQNIVKITGTIPQYETLQNIFESHPQVLVTTPSYVEIELCGRCSIDCCFCYRKALQYEHHDMEIQTLEAIISQMRTYNTPYAVCFGGSGEPLLHKKFYRALELCNAEKLIHTIVVETNGIYADSNFAAAVASYDTNKIKTIVNINGHNPDTYKKIHNADYFTTVHRNITKLKEILLSHDKFNSNLYIQIMKINETEPFLDAYYDFWEQYNIPIILQKQNTFLGLIQDRRYSDLTPLERKPCWHLRQDIYIFSDGTVAFCKQDINGLATRGNVLKEGIPALWEIQKQCYVNDYKGNRAQKPNCSACDEWYTYNL